MNHPVDHAIWRRSSFCADGACVEVAITGDEVLVRNSLRPTELTRFTRAEWRALLAGAANSEFDV
jgi:hypothetical protein